MNTNFANSSGGGQHSLVMQPIMIPMDTRRPYPKMNVTVLRTFSIFCVILGVLSMAIQIAILIVFYASTVDVIGYGIWGGAFYLIAGSLGIAATQKRAKSLLISSLVWSALSIAASITASVLSGLAAALTYYCYSYSCQVYAGLEWTLFALNVLTIATSITLVIFISMTLCSKKHPSINGVIPGFPQQPYNFATNGQPIYFQPPIMQQSHQLVQLQPTAFQQGYVVQQK